MGSYKQNYNQGDIALSAFALALALPVRIYIIRTIINLGNTATKDDLYTSQFSADTIARHLQQLKSLKILKAQSVNKKISYNVDTAYFQMMSHSFNSFIEAFDHHGTSPVGQPLAATEGEQALSFGDYLKTQRISFQLTQAQMAEQLDMDRSVLSKAETGRGVFPEDKLLVLSQKLHEDIDSIKKMYYSDQVAGLIRKGLLDEPTLHLARLKSSNSNY